MRNQRHQRSVSSASFHKSRCPQMHVTAQNTTHIEDSLSVLESRSEFKGVVHVPVPLLSGSVFVSASSSRVDLSDGNGVPDFLRRTIAISARHILARPRRLFISSAEQSRSIRVRSAKIHRMCTSVGVWVVAALTSLLVVSTSMDLRYKSNQCVKYMIRWRERRWSIWNSCVGESSLGFRGVSSSDGVIEGDCWVAPWLFLPRCLPCEGFHTDSGAPSRKAHQASLFFLSGITFCNGPARRG